jgi:hypothetical protein
MANTTWNTADKTASVTLSNGNLTATITALGNQGARSIYSTAAGKYYWEYTFTNTTNDGCGIVNLATALSTTGVNGVAGAAYVNSTGNVLVNSTSNSATLGVFATGNIACIALDLDNRLIWFRKGAAGNWNNSGTANPATGVGGFALTFVGAGVAAYGLMTGQSATNGAITANFGDSAFAGVVPAGFAAGFPGTAVAAANAVRAMVLA